MKASYYGYVEVVRLLLSHANIDINLKNKVKNLAWKYDSFSFLFRMAPVLLMFVVNYSC
jgi:hypothetical protein